VAALSVYMRVVTFHLQATLHTTPSLLIIATLARSAVHTWLWLLACLSAGCLRAQLHCCVDMQR
jgi:hypothetical protein